MTVSLFYHRASSLAMILLFFICVTVTVHAATQTDIAAPGGGIGGNFGASVTTLPNGNIVVTDPGFDQVSPAVTNIGAVYLYNGATSAVISTLKGSTTNDQVGSGGVVVLANGNYVILSTGWNSNRSAVTFGNAATGVSGTVSATNSLVSSFTDSSLTRVTTLPNGSYVVSNHGWNSQRGAVTFGNGTTGISGTISSAISLVGSSANDLVGFDVNSVVVLTNGNYVVSTFRWDTGGLTDVGAVTFGNGVTGISGTISSTNSLIGSATNDQVGGSGVTALTNGNYVVRSQNWDDGATANVGAVTFGNGTTGVSGTISSANSLVGNAANQALGVSPITALTNGNYVVPSVSHSSNRGAVTWGNGTTGVSGTISTANSLVGSAANSNIGNGGVTALTNGNYVVLSTSGFGAATWGNGATGTFGTVSAANSLVGSATNDFSGSTVTALTNGNYVVANGNWNQSRGAATFRDGTANGAGTISAANSLIGSATGERVGINGVTALTNGNYVVATIGNGNGGAATWGNGVTGTTGTVSAANSIVGSTAGDFSSSTVTPLTNGNYVVAVNVWNNGAVVDAGAVTFASGTAPTILTISPSNSLVGSTTNDNVGRLGVKVLSNGNYVVSSDNWDNGAIANAGAVTWGSGTTGVSGTVSAANSLVGSSSNDLIGANLAAQSSVTALANGNYTVDNYTWDSGATGNAGAVTYGAGNGGTIGAINSNNSVRGTVANGGTALRFGFDAVNEQLVVGRPNSNTVSLFRPTHVAIADGNSNAATTWNYGAFTKTGDVIVPSGRSVTLDHNFSANQFDVPAGASVNVSGNRSLNLGVMTLEGFLDLTNGGLNTNGALLNTNNSGTISGASATNYIVGKVKRNLTTGDFYTFPVGTANGYAPVTFQGITGTGEVIVTPNQGTYPNTASGLPTNRLRRWWNLENPGGGITQTNIQFGYLDADITGTEANYAAYRMPTGGGAATQLSGGANVTSNQIFALNVTAFSDWTAADTGGTTAAEITLGGRVVSANGDPIARARVILSDDSGSRRMVFSNSLGYFKFENVASGASYIMQPSHKRYTFAPQIVSPNASIDNLQFTAAP